MCVMRLFHFSRMNGGYTGFGNKVPIELWTFIVVEDLPLYSTLKVLKKTKFF